MIAAEGLAKRYGHALALRGVSLEAGPGDIVGLIGPNGAGKTTTIRILASLIAPDAGRARVAGCDVVTQVAELRRRIGYMPELFGLYDELSIEQYLDFFAGVYGFCGRERRRIVAEVLDLVDLKGKRDDRCEGLSKGVRQRVYLARTLLHDPDVLLLDEPASGLDPQARIDLRVLLGYLQGQGKTLLVSSHILSELEQICTRVVVIEAGRVRFAGTLAQVSETLGERELSLRFLEEEGAERALALLEGEEGLSALTRTGARLALRTSAPREGIAALHRRLVEAEIPLFSFEVREASLESLFLDVTRGEVR